MRISWIAARCYALLTARGRWVESCRRLVARACAPGARRLLDVGAGPGTVALEMGRMYPDAAVVGLDASRRMLAEARREQQRSRGAEEQRSGGAVPPAPLPPCPSASLRGVGEGRVLWVCGDAAHLPFRAGVFDGVAGHSVLYLTAEPEGVLREVARVLRAGGRAGFVEPRSEILSGWTVRMGGRFLLSMMGWRCVSRSHRRYDEQEMVDLLKACGYCEVRSEAAVEGFGVCVTGRK